MSQTKMSGTRKVIGLWLDRVSDPAEPAWIVSRDEMYIGGPDAGGAATTETVAVYTEDDYEAARARAVALADRSGRPVVTDGEDVYTPASE